VFHSIAAQLDADPSELTADPALLKRLPDLLKACEYRPRCIVFKDRSRWVLCGIQEPGEQKPPAGRAVDLGTTNVVLRLVNLLSGEVLAESVFDNPQIRVGPDILTRIHFGKDSHGLDRLNRLIVEGVNSAAESLCRSCGLLPTDIFVMTLAGNTTMTHLLMGLPPLGLIREPYIPVTNRPGTVKAKELGIGIHEHGRVFIFPNVGSYFGGDLIAGILYTGVQKSDALSILLDIGTNAEVVLGNSEWLIACAGAAGPALEGGVTSMGMMAGPGVVDEIRIDPDTQAFSIHTIGDQAPRGICGSGLIDLAAQLFRAGMIDIRGKLRPRVCGERLVERNGFPHLVVVPAEEAAEAADLTISQADLDSLIRSKAAMYTILETITQTVGVAVEDIGTFYVAGTFGAYIRPESAVTIGMMPDLPRDRFQAIGNSAIEGATLALTRPALLDEVDEIRDRITYLELNVNQDFMNRFSAAKFLPHTDRDRFPSVKVNHEGTSS
jgi:uncharacterized 2Fe-2S/4Fe-4S cluster protein (DUF4445 family)